MQVKVLSRSEVESGAAQGVDGVISIRGFEETFEPELTETLNLTTRGEAARLLRLRFDDIGMARYGHFVGPTLDQIGEAIAFGRRIARDAKDRHAPTIAIHCEHGKSRSAALALALLADWAGDGREGEAVDALLQSDIEKRMHPNPFIVDLADDYLARAGRLHAALAAHSPAYVKWRDLWVKVIADPDAYWETAKRALAQRS